MAFMDTVAIDPTSCSKMMLNIPSMNCNQSFELYYTTSSPTNIRIQEITYNLFQKSSKQSG